ncbi:unnamed protein product, partial [Tetraodon nigroviridis]
KIRRGRVVEDKRSRHCPYLDTINRSVLDFDFEKLCSISLSHINVYACLICGKYFQGRGLKSHAYTHSVQFTHHVFLNLHTLKFYCLPDNYEIIDSSLEDITYVLKPTFTKQHIGGLDKQGKLYRAYDGTTYLPGIVGLNNIKANDYANVVLQAFCNVPPFAKLLSGGGELQGNPQATRGHNVPLGAEVWRAYAEALESQKLQGPCVSS